MPTQLESILIECLKGTLKVLVYTDSRDTLSAINQKLSPYPMFSLTCVGAQSLAEEALRQVRHWHAVVVDSGRLGNLWPTVSEYCRYWVPVGLLMDGARKKWGQSEADGEDVPCSIGPRAVVFKCTPRSSREFLESVQYWSLTRLLFSTQPDRFALKAFKRLCSDNPVTVEEWSELIHSNTRKFQREFKHYSELSPKKIVALYHANRIAFEVINRELGVRQSPISAYLVDDKSRARVMEYVLTRRSMLLETG
jgi:AraC-like DNA-binding protein